MSRRKEVCDAVEKAPKHIKEAAQKVQIALAHAMELFKNIPPKRPLNFEETSILLLGITTGMGITKEALTDEDLAKVYLLIIEVVISAQEDADELLRNVANRR